MLSKMKTPLRARWLTTSLVIAQLLILLAIGLQWFEFGSKAGSWVYPYLKPVDFWSVEIGVGLALLICMAAMSATRWLDQYEGLVVGGAFLSLTALETLIRSRYPFGLDILVLSDQVNGFYSAALRVDVQTLLATWGQSTDWFRWHLRTNLPGKVLLYQLLTLLWSDPQAAGTAIIAAANISALAVYGIVRELANDRRIAFLALVLCTLTPSKVLFEPDLNVVSPALLMLMFLLLLVALRTGRLVYALGLGLLAYVAFLFEPLPFALGVVFVVLLARSIRLRQLSPRNAAKILLAAIVSCAIVYGIFATLLHFDLWSAFRSALNEAVITFNASTNRPYRLWVIHNLKEYLVSAGVAGSLIFIGSVLAGARKGIFQVGAEGVMLALALALACMLILLDVLDINRGESTRLWIFATPLQQAVVAYVCLRWLGEHAYLIVLSGAILQILLCISTVGFMIP